MKKVIFILIACLIPFLCFAEEENINPFPENEGSIYEYSQDDIPDILFFPAEKARWNGNEVKIKDWDKLTDFQKVSFISEYTNLLETKYKTDIDLEDGWKYLIMVNRYVSQYKEEDSNNKPMTEVVEGFLRINNQIPAK